MNEWLIATGGGHIAAIIAVAAVFLDARLLGAIFVKATGLKIRHPVLFPVVSLIIGMDILIGLAFFAGLFGLFSSPLVKYAMFAISAISLADIARSLGATRSSVGKHMRRNYIFLLLFLATAIFTFGNSLCLPICWDELCYQLAVPLRWLNDGAIQFYPDNPYSAFPGTGNFLFMLNIYLGGILAARLFLWALWMLSLISLYHILKQGNSAFNASAMTFSFGLSCIMLMCGSSAYVEIIILIHFICAFAILKNSNNAPSGKDAYALGIICGIASSVKLTGLIVGLSFSIYFIGMALMTRRITFKPLAAYYAIFVLVLVMFYSRPWLETGNPFYPYCARYFTSSPAAIETSVYHHLAGSVKYGIQGISGFFAAPILISLPINTYDGNMGLQFIVAILLAAFSLLHALRKRDWKKFLPVFFFLAIFYVFWFFTAQQARFFVLAGLMFYIAIKTSLTGRKTYLKIIVCASFILMLWSFPSILVEYFASSWKCLSGQMRPADFVYSGTGEGFLQAMDMIRMKTPQNAKFLLLFENRGLYMPRKYEIGTPFLQEKYFTPPEKFENEDKILEILGNNNITHILVGLSLRDPDRMKEYLKRSVGFSAAIGRLAEQGKIKPIWDDSGYAIFECEYSPAPSTTAKRNKD